MNSNSTKAFLTTQIDVILYLGRKTETSAIAPSQILTPQRKACYRDKHRIRLKDVKSWALRRAGCKNAAEVKKYLKTLNLKLDLRLTSAWIAVNIEFASDIKSLSSRQGEAKKFDLHDFKISNCQQEQQSPEEQVLCPIHQIVNKP